MANGYEYQANAFECARGLVWGTKTQAEASSALLKAGQRTTSDPCCVGGKLTLDSIDALMGFFERNADWIAPIVLQMNQPTGDK